MNLIKNKDETNCNSVSPIWLLPLVLNDPINTGTREIDPLMIDIGVSFLLDELLSSAAETSALITER